MLTAEEIKEFTDKLKRIDEEIMLLQDDKKSLFDDLKNRVKPAVLKEAIRQARLRQRMGDEVAELDQIIDILEREL